MLCAAAERGAGVDLRLVLAPMDALPVCSGTVDLVIAHGIWNLARSGLEFRRAIAEAARVATAEAALFVFTFSRRTLPAMRLLSPVNHSSSRSSPAVPRCS